MTRNKLYIVATPIGNLDDISVRAVKVLSEAELIITENQSTTRKLFSLLNISAEGKKLITFADFNNTAVLESVVEKIKTTENTALVSEAGTPLISDPGFKIVNYIHSEKLEIDVISVPGASSVIAHLSISGLPTDNFMFVGFLPKKLGKATKIIESFSKINTELKTTFVIMESKYRLEKTLVLLKEIYPNCLVSLGIELTKKFERVYYGNIQEVLEKVESKKVNGEIIIHLQLLPDENKKPATKNNT